MAKITASTAVEAVLKAHKHPTVGTFFAALASDLVGPIVHLLSCGVNNTAPVLDIRHTPPLYTGVAQKVQ